MPTKFGFKHYFSAVATLFLLFAIPLTVRLAQTPYTPKYAADSEPLSINQLNNLLIGYSNNDPGTTNFLLENSFSITDVASLRKQILLSYLPDNPDQFIQQVLPESTRSKLPPSLVDLGLLEKEQMVQGSVQVVVIDREDTAHTPPEYYIDKQRIYIPEGSVSLTSGSHIETTGIALDTNIVLPNPLSFTEVQLAQQISPIGQRSMLVIPVEFANSSPPSTKQALEEGFFGDTDSLSHYYQIVSKNKLSVNGIITEKIVLSISPTTCDYLTWTNTLDSVAENRGYVLSDFDNIFYVLPGDGVYCPFLGAADLGGRRAWSKVGHVDLSIFAHEYGHNLGMMHAGTYDCGPRQVDMLSNCTIDEYGDRYSLMGKTLNNVNQLNAPHKVQMGWIDSSAVHTVSKDETVVLSAHELEMTGIQAVRIWSGGDKGNYFLSFRKAVNYDADLPADLFEGTHIHFTPNDAWTYFVDTTPQSDTSASTYLDFQDAPLTDGSMFIDESAGVSVTQLSHTSDAVTVSINIPDNYEPFVEQSGVAPNSGELGRIPLNATIMAIDSLDDILTATMTVILPNGMQEVFSMGEVRYPIPCSPRCFKFYYQYMPQMLGVHTVRLDVRDTNGVSVSRTHQFTAVIPEPTRTLTPTLPPRFTPTPTPSCSNKILGNVNCLNGINLSDLSQLLSHFGSTNQASDVNGDGLVNLTDLSTLLANFGKSF